MYTFAFFAFGVLSLCLQTISKTNVKELFPCVFLEGLSSVWSSFLCIASWSGEISLYKWISSFPTAVSEEMSFLHCVFWVPYQKLVDHICLGFFLGSLLLHWSMCLFLCQCHTVWIAVALQYVWKSGIRMPLLFFFLSKIVLSSQVLVCSI